MSVRTNSAAFFDLDKTIIAKSSVLAFGKPFYREGLLSRRSIVKSIYAQVVFMLVGADEAEDGEAARRDGGDDAGLEPRPRGVDRARDADDVIEPIIYAEALELFDEHHAAGRKVVIVSSSPLEVVEPLAEFLGADEVIGTRPPVDADGNYTGELEFYAYGDEQGARRSGSSPPGRTSISRVVRLQRLDHRPPDARGRRPPGRREPRQGAGPDRAGAGVGDTRVRSVRCGYATACRCRRRARRSRSAACSPPPAPASRCGGGCAARTACRADDIRAAARPARPARAAAARRLNRWTGSRSGSVGRGWWSSGTT